MLKIYTKFIKANYDGEEQKTQEEEKNKVSFNLSFKKNFAAGTFPLQFLFSPTSLKIIIVVIVTFLQIVLLASLS